MAIVRVRVVALKQLGQADRPPRSSSFNRTRAGKKRGFGPGLDGNPVLWRAGVAPPPTIILDANYLVDFCLLVFGKFSLCRR